MEGQLKAYKGFDKDLKCRNFQYEIGKTYEEETAKLCRSGFHACEKPLDVFNYYNPCDSRFCEVVMNDVSDEKGKDSKRVSKKITIGAEIGIPDLVKAHIDQTTEQVKKDGIAMLSYKRSAAKSGNGSSAATPGNFSSAATSGDWSSAATLGEWSSAAASGKGSSAIALDDRSSAAASGDESIATALGDWSSAIASGYKSTAAASGKGSSAIASGNLSAACTFNKNGIAVACGKNSQAKGIIGSYIVVTEWNYDETELITAKMVRVDGKIIKSDTWYKLKNGEFVEVKT